MAIIPQQRLFERLRLVKEYMPDEALMQRLACGPGSLCDTGHGGG